MQDKKVSDAQERIRFVFKWDSRFRSWTTSTIHHFRQLNGMLLSNGHQRNSQVVERKKRWRSFEAKTRAERREKNPNDGRQSSQNCRKHLAQNSQSMRVQRSSSVFEYVRLSVCCDLRWWNWCHSCRKSEKKKYELFVTDRWRIHRFRCPCLWRPATLLRRLVFFRTLLCINFLLLFSMVGSAFGWVHISRRNVVGGAWSAKSLYSLASAALSRWTSESLFLLFYVMRNKNKNGFRSFNPTSTPDIFVSDML